MNSTTIPISHREREVLELIALGSVCKQIAEKLEISETTVITYKNRLKAKFGVSNSCELIYVTSKQGLI